MSQQNFVQQINLFMEYGKRNRLTSYERMFWLGLFHIANDLAQKNPKHEWPDDFFPVSNSTFSEWTGLEERNLRSIKNRFRQIGLIDFKKGDGKKSDPEYRLFYLRYIGYKIVPDSVTDKWNEKETDDKNVPGCVGGSVGDSVSDTVSGAVGDERSTGSRFAPDDVADSIPSTSNPNIYYKYKRGTVNAASNSRVIPKRETLSAPARGGYAGLVDMGDDFGEDAGLVPLPWDGGGQLDNF